MNLVQRTIVCAAWAVPFYRVAQGEDWLTLTLLAGLCLLYLRVSWTGSLRAQVIHGLWQQSLYDILPIEKMEEVNKRYNVLRGAYNAEYRGFFRVRS